jgi:hypothetical protein
VARIHIARSCVSTIMTGLLILLAVLVVPYVALNVRRVLEGRSWAFTFCQAAREWEESHRAAQEEERRTV